MKTDKKEHLSEKNILAAARLIFQTRGYYGTRMQDIADEAGINKAMLHYYFRSKDKLFEKIIEDVFTILVGNISEVLTSELTFEEKISAFFEQFIDALKKNPHFPAFLIHEINHNFGRIEDLVSRQVINIPPIFILEIKDQIKAGKIKDISPYHLLMNMLAMSIFPFAARPLLQNIFGLSDERYDSFIEERKKILPDLVLNGLKKK